MVSLSGDSIDCRYSLCVGNDNSTPVPSGNKLKTMSFRNISYVTSVTKAENAKKKAHSKIGIGWKYFPMNPSP
jgi:hypothetical protein